MTRQERKCLLAAVLALGFVGGTSARAQTYDVADTVENFSLIDRATGEPVNLTDYEGKVVFLEWFAWWCPYCQAAAAQTGTGIPASNSHGVPVAHVSVNLQGGEESDTQAFIDYYGLGQVLNDFDRSVANRFQTGGQPIFAVINGVSGSPSHGPWELVYSHLGYGELQTPIATFLAAINSVEAAVVDPPAPPKILEHPLSQTVLPGSDVTLSVDVADGDPVASQWTRDGVPIAGATDRQLALTDVQAADAGYYRAEATNNDGTVVSRYARLVVGTPVPSRIINLSVRAPAGVGGLPLIVGFAVNGGSKPLLIRGVGPRLADLDVPNVLADPQLTVFSGSEPVAENDDWSSDDAATVAATAASVSAFSLPVDSLDAALVTTLTGTRTVHIAGKDGDVGVALAEVYDAGSSGEARLVNISARNFVGTGGDILISGFVINGNEPVRLLIRGIGPGLQQFDVPDVLADPILEVHTSIDGKDTIVATNDDWGDEPNPLEWKTVVPYAFSLDEGSKDAVLLITLPAGLYTVHVRGANETTGNALVEVYEAP